MRLERRVGLDMRAFLESVATVALIRRLAQVDIVAGISLIATIARIGGLQRVAAIVSIAELSAILRLEMVSQIAWIVALPFLLPKQIPSMLSELALIFQQARGSPPQLCHEAPSRETHPSTRSHLPRYGGTGRNRAGRHRVFTARHAAQADLAPGQRARFSS